MQTESSRFLCSSVDCDPFLQKKYFHEITGVSKAQVLVTNTPVKVHSYK